MAQINPKILVWARETAGLSEDEASKALKLGGSRLSGSETLGQYESGEKQLSRPLLLNMAKVYRRPLLTFYLQAPPRSGERGEDFRTIPEDRRIEEQGKLDALVRDVYVRQRLVKSALEDADEANELAFVGSLTSDLPIDMAKRKICEDLNFDLERFRKLRTVEDSFSYLRELTEARGVFVLLIGNLGTHHSNISADVFRGFALADRTSPFIVINDQDAKTAWSFTLLHELAHIYLGQTGISGGFSEIKIERYCNEIASQILLPREEISSQEFDSSNLESFIKDICRFAAARKISGSMVSYVLFLLGKVPKSKWIEASEKLQELWRKEKQGKKNSEKKGAPDYYVVRRHRVGSALVNLVGRSMGEGILTATKAAKVLGVSPGNVPAMVGMR